MPSSPDIRRGRRRQYAPDPPDEVVASLLRNLRRAALYVAHGLAFLRCAPWLYVAITCTYVTPALLAGLLTASVREPALWQQAIVVALPWLTIVLGPVVIMVAVRYHSKGQSVGLGRVTYVALRWLPRYVWTNVHTSCIFWAPISLLLTARGWQQEALAIAWLPEEIVDGLWWLCIASAALYLHTRTLLAPFLAVHADLPATLAAMEAWRLAGHHFLACVATLVLGVLPVGVPLGLVGLAGAAYAAGPAQGALIAAAPHLFWAWVQAVRPVLIPSLYLLYGELWAAELTRKQQEAPPDVPVLLRALLAVTQPFPKLGRWD